MILAVAALIEGAVDFAFDDLGTRPDAPTLARTTDLAVRLGPGVRRGNMTPR